MVKEWFENRNIPQSEIAEVIGITKSTVSRKLNPKQNAKFTLDEIKLLNKWYKIPIELFFKD